jgi:hypothetical protein
VDSLFLWLAFNFDGRVFSRATLIQGSFWSIADFSLVFGFLRLASLAREKCGKRKTVGRYVLFWIAAIANPYFLFYHTGTAHDMLIMSVFFLAIYAALVDGSGILKLLKQE